MKTKEPNYRYLMRKNKELNALLKAIRDGATYWIIHHSRGILFKDVNALRVIYHMKRQAVLKNFDGVDNRLYSIN